jgi:cytochrome c peroxidase
MPTPATDAAEGARVARGRELFHAEQVGCASCHREGGSSDGARHEVGSGLLLDTPSLRFVAGTAPYFHDGRYPTLAAMLRATRGTMGWGGDLADADLDALEAYLLTL